METAYNVVTALMLVLPCACIIFFVAFLLLMVLNKPKAAIVFLCWAGILLFLMIPTAIADAGLDLNMAPQCPNCEKSVSSAFCPDCGWEAASQLDDKIYIEGE